MKRLLLLLSLASCADDDSRLDVAGTWALTLTPTSGTCANVTSRPWTIDVTGDPEAYHLVLREGLPTYTITLGGDCESDRCDLTLLVVEHDASMTYTWNAVLGVDMDLRITGNVDATATGPNGCQHHFNVQGGIAP